ncbi:MAG TPA: type I-U CRISPR-associated RAMP protein Csb1/Cas7u [Vicinamibacterales bacterium]
MSDAVINGWADCDAGPVALCLIQKLLPIDGPGGVIFPPTYKDIGYNIDQMSDGTKVATIDSVGSQANRLEPLFKRSSGVAPSGHRLAELVPQVTIVLGNGREVSLFDAGHRLGDAIVRSTRLKEAAREAFLAFLERGDAGPLAKLAPTSLVFGVWDSRDTSAKLPRILQAVIRAWNVDVLTRSAVYAPPVDYAALEVFSDDDKAKAEGDTKSPLAKRGFVHVPAGESPGGIVAHGDIIRTVTINLVALRRLNSSRDGDTVRRYLLGLALVVATEPADGFLRQGCLLTLDPAHPGAWQAVGRDGVRDTVTISSDEAWSYALAAAKAFGIESPETVAFDKEFAKADLADGAKKRVSRKPRP